MCGVIGAFVADKENIKEDITAIYTEQKTRGSDGFGIGIKKPGGLLLRQRTKTSEEIFKDDIWNKIEQGDYVLFHHRQPTSTPNHELCNHPISNEDGSLLLIHNGVLSKDNLIGKHKFETLVTITYSDSKGKVIRKEEKFTDTELAVHDFEEYLAAGNDCVASIKGIGQDYSSAFLVLHKNFDGLLFVANSYPLFGYKGGENYFLSSEKPLVRTLNPTTKITTVSYNRNGVNLRDDFGFLRGGKIFKDGGKFNSYESNYSRYSTSCQLPPKKEEETKIPDASVYDDMEFVNGVWVDKNTQPDEKHTKDIREELSAAFNCDGKCDSCRILSCMAGVDWCDETKVKEKLVEKYGVRIADVIFEMFWVGA